MDEGGELTIIASFCRCRPQAELHTRYNRDISRTSAIYSIHPSNRPTYREWEKREPFLNLWQSYKLFLWLRSSVTKTCCCSCCLKMERQITCRKKERKNLIFCCPWRWNFTHNWKKYYWKITAERGLALKTVVVCWVPFRFNALHPPHLSLRSIARKKGASN